MTSPAITSNELHKRYGHIHALKGVSLEIAPGQIFGLIGANGAGKSTFIRLLVGASRPSDGRLCVLDLDPLRDAAKLRQQIGYMPQSPALYEDLSAAENVRFFGQAHRLDKLKLRVAEALEFVELSERADDPVSTLSGGMRQRVSLACAVVHQPTLLLLDEPTAGVDLKLRSAFWRHFSALAEQGTTILVSTHQMDEAVHCHNLAIISEGRIIANETPQSLLQRGRTQVRLWADGQPEQAEFQHYPSELPAWLRSHGLDEAVERIELEASTMEAIVLEMMADTSNGKDA
jgi:ABC-2 type transport system ATP-binding protein